MTSIFHQEHPDAALARAAMPPNLVNIARPWIGAPPKPIDKWRHHCSVKPVFRTTNGASAESARTYPAGEHGIGRHWLSHSRIDAAVTVPVKT
ncbi:hypothetical protein ACFVXE_38125 [Streptomyces sp. NPDC058231]|uniref:hypothetical protein n=1 Tax=Streptomyces sp. NPDC058231 TaxID=3346392 RepID=UPI0036E66C57